MPNHQDLVDVARILLDLAKQGADQRATPDTAADVRLRMAEEELDAIINWLEN